MFACAIHHLNVGSVSSRTGVSNFCQEVPPQKQRSSVELLSPTVRVDQPGPGAAAPVLFGANAQGGGGCRSVAVAAADAAVDVGKALEQELRRSLTKLDEASHTLRDLGSSERGAPLRGHWGAFCVWFVLSVTSGFGCDCFVKQSKLAVRLLVQPASVSVAALKSSSFCLAAPPRNCLEHVGDTPLDNGGAPQLHGSLMSVNETPLNFGLGHHASCEQG